MGIRIEKWGDDYALPLPIEIVEKYGLKDGDWLNLSEDALKLLFSKTKEADQAEGGK